jgi:hypothetical protein
LNGPLSRFFDDAEPGAIAGIDLLVAAHQAAVTTSGPLRQLLDNYSVRPIGAGPRRERAMKDVLAAGKGDQ